MYKHWELSVLIYDREEKTNHLQSLKPIPGVPAPEFFKLRAAGRSTAYSPAAFLKLLLQHCEQQDTGVGTSPV